MLDDVIRFLVCPLCGQSLHRDAGSLRCTAGHVFDISRQGYVSLLPPGVSGGRGDTAAMVQARAEFLAADHFSGLAGELALVISRLLTPVRDDGCVIDVGAGTGYYLATVLDRLPDRIGLALDLSKYALRRAARAHPHVGAVACDVWRRFPVADGAAVAVVNVFAPRNVREFARVLNPAGQLFVVTPGRDHLTELISPLQLLSVDERKDEQLIEDLSPSFSLAGHCDYRATLSLSHRDVAAAVAMGPSAWHVDAADLNQRIKWLPHPMPTTTSARISIFQLSALC